ncbi:LysR family transcriptional regulator [Pseudoalteromonas sp. HM-SA03]|uniref:LysR family transcriptional regulator n=1 Tax=Pseudoalteromonas sp. HM-SA03 TaxID=2029678 RepID=UPI000BAE08C7|nr:LysR family transcriptional regulator [Pseudoalteromonas sp. HM-SA03]PAY01753.1 LysR family transcriptional regulator [Pseudoalteromonas sp. HM-SA03]
MSHLTQLKTFVEVYRCKNITKAAANLGMSQPAVTAHIQTMEAVVGKALFERQARGVKPTPTAHDLALQVSGHIDILEQKITSIRARSNAVFGTLNIVGPAEYLSFVSGPQIANLLQAGNINVVLHIGNKINIFDALIHDTADIAIAASAPDPTTFDYLVLDKEQLWLVMNRLEGREIQDSDITADLLSSYNVVTYDQDLPLVRQYFDRVFNASCNSNVIAICPDIRAIANIIRSGIGYSVLPDYLCRDLIKAGELIQLGPVGPENNIYLVWKKGALKHPRIAFAKDVISAFANINYLSN